MGGSAAIRGNETRKPMRGATQALTGHHPDAAPHQARSLALDMRRRTRKHIRRVVHQDKDFDAIDRFKCHARLLAYVPRHLQWTESSHQKAIARAFDGPRHIHQSKADALEARAAAAATEAAAAKTRRAATAAATAATRTASGAGNDARLHRQQAFALHLLARQLAGAADRFRLFPRLLFRGFFVMAAKLHLAENALALHLLFERLEGLVDIVVANENLHACSLVV